MKKILIVDDEMEIRDLVEITLSFGEHTIFKAHSAEEAIKIAKAEKPHVILMDIDMPGDMNGLQATAKIKQDPELSKSKIIMLTSLGHESDKKRGYDAGADDYFVKPFSPLNLINKIDEVLSED